MDVTTVNDRHLYEGRVLVRAPGAPDGRLELAERVVRFGPPGWLTVVERHPHAVRIEVYPVSEVLAVTELREVDAAGVDSYTS